MSYSPLAPAICADLTEPLQRDTLRVAAKPASETRPLSRSLACRETGRAARAGALHARRRASQPWPRHWETPTASSATTARAS